MTKIWQSKSVWIDSDRFKFWHISYREIFANSHTFAFLRGLCFHGC